MVLDIVVAFLVGLAAYGCGAWLERKLGPRPSSNADLAEQLERIIKKLEEN